MKGRANSGLPTWWKTEHDIAFLKGVARWGIIKTELMVEGILLLILAFY